MSPTEEKIELFNNAHANMPTLFVVFDPKNAAALLPDELKTKDSCQFQYGQLLMTPTNPVVTTEGIVCDLSFGGKNRPTFVPWSAVYCIHFDVDGRPRGKVWEASIPEAVKQANAKNKPETAPVVKTRPTAEAKRVQQPDGTFSLAAFRENRAARATNGK